MTPVEQIKEKLDIVDFIKSYIELKPAGKNFKAPCPFHKEKTASFIVSPDRQTWHCFGACSEGGDIFKFLMKYENLEFYEALKILADKAGVELRKISPTDQKQFGVLYDINEDAKNFFKAELIKSNRAKEYLKSRGITGETAKEFEIGMSPSGYDDLNIELINRGYDVKDIDRAGLIFKTEHGSYMDRFRNRVMFPIYNSFGKVVGFSGRVLPEFDNGESGKYVNSPETPIFNKSRVLYGFHKSKNHIREQKLALLVEGQMDFLMTYQDGVKNVVATSGTALTFDHLQTLKKSTDNLVFCFDNDEAGLKAAERGIDLAEGFDFNVKLLVLSGYKDPGEVAFKEPGAMAKFLKEAKPAMEFYFDRYLNLNNDKVDIGELKKRIRIILGKIKNITSPVEKGHWIKELAKRAKINEKSLAEEMEQLKTPDNNFQAHSQQNEQTIPANDIGLKKNRRELIAEHILMLISAKNHLKSRLEKYLEYLPEDYRSVYDCIIEKKCDKDVSDLLNSLSLRSGFLIEKIGEEKIEIEFENLLKELKLDFFKEKKEELSRQIKECEKYNDEEKLAKTLKEFDEISKMLQNN